MKENQSECHCSCHKSDPICNLDKKCCREYQSEKCECYCHKMGMSDETQKGCKNCPQEQAEGSKDAVTEGWEERFDEMINEVANNCCKVCQCVNGKKIWCACHRKQIKDFIKTTREEAKEEERARLREWAEKYQGDYSAGDFINGKQIKIPLIKLPDLLAEIDKK